MDALSFWSFPCLRGFPSSNFTDSILSVSFQKSESLSQKTQALMIISQSLWKVSLNPTFFWNFWCVMAWVRVLPHRSLLALPHYTPQPNYKLFLFSLFLPLLPRNKSGHKSLIKRLIPLYLEKSIENTSHCVVAHCNDRSCPSPTEGRPLPAQI